MRTPINCQFIIARLFQHFCTSHWIANIMWQQFISNFREVWMTTIGARSPFSPLLKVKYVSLVGRVNKCNCIISPAQSLPPSGARFMLNLNHLTITSQLLFNMQRWVKWIAFWSILLTEILSFFLVDTTWKMRASMLATHWLPVIRDT